MFLTTAIHTLWTNGVAMSLIGALVGAMLFSFFYFAIRAIQEKNAVRFGIFAASFIAVFIVLICIPIVPDLLKILFASQSTLGGLTTLAFVALLYKHQSN